MFLLMTDRSSRNIFTGGLTETAPEQSSECRLWRQVLSQAISDAYLNDRKQRQSVAEWIASNDFRTVCDFAFVDFFEMRKIFDNILSRRGEEAREEGREIKQLLER